MTKRIAIVTGGGDCPGLNAVIRAAAKSASLRGWETLGIIGGYEGLLTDDRHINLDYKSVGGLLTRGGTILGTANRGKFSAKVGHGESRRLPTELLEETKRGMERLGDVLAVAGWKFRTEKVVEVGRCHGEALRCSMSASEIT